jgi:3-hydroxyisobutyrate dehydrogenase-like beta-hydroxyacid dehydrogenase
VTAGGGPPPPAGAAAAAGAAGAGAGPLLVAVLGLGEAGGRVAADLAAAGARVRGFDPAVPVPPGIEPATGDADACRGAALVISLTTAAESEQALRQALAGLGPGTVYADANTASAGQKQKLASIAADAGVPFADIAIMAPIPQRGLRTPMLASGPAAAAAAGLLNGHGAAVQVLPGPAGAAATRKLLRSVFYKGMAAAVVEALRAARAAGQEDWMREHVAAELAAATADTADRLERGSYQHATRRAHEMAAASELLTELGVPPRVAMASQQWLEDLAAGSGGPGTGGGDGNPPAA